jgi:hypothetical protein
LDADGSKRLRVYAVTCVVLGLAGLPLGPLIMAPAYQVLQPAMGPMTLIAVEMLFALLIDFPLATLASAVITRSGRARNAREGALAGVSFLTVFMVLILACIVGSGLGPWIASLALSDVFPQAVASASKAFGPVTFGLMGLMFVAFDYCLCLLGGVAGFYAGTLLTRRGATKQG